jgi:hypothetical protein
VANLVVFPAIEHRSRLEPPRGLALREREMFTELAAQAGHLKPCDAPLLASLAQSIILSRRLARDPARLAEWERVTRTQMALSRSLRMTPQSRVDARSRTARRADRTKPMVKLTPASAQRRDEFFALMKRFNQLGCLLPSPDDFDASNADAGELAEVEVVLAELDRVPAAMKAVLLDEAWANA